MTIAFLGGTGDQGRGLARRFAMAGQPVVLGSRDADRAGAAALELAATIAGDAGAISGATNADAAAGAEVVVVAVPYDGHASLIGGLVEELRGKIVVDCVNPLGFDKQGAFALDVPDGSAALEALRLLPESRVVAAFHHISAVLLLDETVGSIDTDVLVLGDDREATDEVQRLVELIPGMRGVYAGRLRNARQVESFTANLISVNRRYKAHAGIRITDI